jgi:hypothetical protein
LVVHYFSLSGDWVAFRRDGDRIVFDTHGRALGWMPWGEGEVVGADGLYLGTVLGNRLVHRAGTRYRCALGRPVLARAAEPAPPGGRQPVAVLPGYEELALPSTLGLASSL